MYEWKRRCRDHGPHHNPGTVAEGAGEGEGVALRSGAVVDIARSRKSSTISVQGVEMMQQPFSFLDERVGASRPNTTGLAGWVEYSDIYTDSYDFCD